METKNAAKLFECLASPVRLEIFRLLVRAEPQGLVAGEIASTLGLPANNTSFHLKTLSQSGLVTAQQEGRFQRYRASMALMGEVVTYLTAECCAGTPEQCPDLPNLPCCEPSP